MQEHSGHRQRMLNKLATERLTEHEILETLLFNALPRHDTRPLAHRLLSRFGTISGVFKASVEELMTVEGVGKAIAGYLSIIGQCFDAYHHLKETPYSGLFDREEFSKYLTNAYCDKTVEEVEILAIDRLGYVLASRRVTSGKTDKVNVPPTLISQLVNEYSPAGIVLVHNHPFGGKSPSDLDDEMTQKVQVFCSYHNILLCDHFIYAKDGVYSYYESGRLKDISKDFSLDNILNLVRKGGIE